MSPIAMRINPTTIIKMPPQNNIGMDKRSPPIMTRAIPNKTASYGIF
jgi:hypothetical protein